MMEVLTLPIWKASTCRTPPSRALIWRRSLVQVPRDFPLAASMPGRQETLGVLHRTMFMIAPQGSSGPCSRRKNHRRCWLGIRSDRRSPNSAWTHSAARIRLPFNSWPRLLVVASMSSNSHGQQRPTFRPSRGALRGVAPSTPPHASHQSPARRDKVRDKVRARVVGSDQDRAPSVNRFFQQPLIVLRSDLVGPG